MIILQKERENAHLSKSKLARMADLNPALIVWAEQRGFALYPVHLERLAAALNWDGDPVALLDQVGE